MVLGMKKEYLYRVPQVAKYKISASAVFWPQMKCGSNCLMNRRSLNTAQTERKILSSSPPGYCSVEKRVMFRCAYLPSKNLSAGLPFKVTPRASAPVLAIWSMTSAMKRSAPPSTKRFLRNERKRTCEVAMLDVWAGELGLGAEGARDLPESGDHVFALFGGQDRAAREIETVRADVLGHRAIPRLGEAFDQNLFLSIERHEAFAGFHALLFERGDDGVALALQRAL